MDFDQEYESDFLRCLARADRLKMSELLAHPDCRDPDHPGCEACDDIELNIEDIDANEAVESMTRKGRELLRQSKEAS